MDRLPSHSFGTVETQKGISKLVILGSAHCGNHGAAKQQLSGNFKAAEQANAVFKSKQSSHPSTSILQHQHPSLLTTSRAGWPGLNSSNFPVVSTQGAFSNDATPRLVNFDVVLFQQKCPTRKANMNHSAVGRDLLGVIDSSTTAVVVSGPASDKEASCGSDNNDNTNPAPLASRSASAPRPYHDYLCYTQLSGKVERRKGRGRAASTFPEQLHRMLEDAEEMDFEDVVSWQPHGRAFMVRDKVRFMREVMPNYFNQSLFASFRRQLNLYGFVRIQGEGHFDRGAYYHELCLRGMPALASYIQRPKQSKPNEASQSPASTQAQTSALSSSSSRSEGWEPNFNNYRPAPGKGNKRRIAESAFQEQNVTTRSQNNFLVTQSPVLIESKLTDTGAMGGRQGGGTQGFGFSTHELQENQVQENEASDFQGPVDVTTLSGLIAIQQRIYSRRSSGGEGEEELPPFIQNLMQSLPCAAEILRGLDFE